MVHRNDSRFCLASCLSSLLHGIYIYIYIYIYIGNESIWWIGIIFIWMGIFNLLFLYVNTNTCLIGSSYWLFHIRTICTLEYIDINGCQTYLSTNSGCCDASLRQAMLASYILFSEFFPGQALPSVLMIRWVRTSSCNGKLWEATSFWHHL